MTNQLIGLVASTGYASKIAQNVQDNLDLENIEFDVKSKQFIEKASNIADIYEAVEEMIDEEKWSKAIILTDLPLFDNNKTIEVDINNSYNISMVSLPAFGPIFISKKLRETIENLVYQMNETENDVNLYKGKTTKESNIKVRKDRKPHERFLLKDNNFFKLFATMTILNNPLNMMSSLSSVVAVAFTTGAFGMVFSTMWNLSNSFSIERMILINLVAIISMTAWIMIAHDLWQTSNNKSEKEIIRLYNLTTLSTLVISIITFYIILYLMFLVASIILLPSEFLPSQITVIDTDKAGLTVYLRIAWFAASISTFAGAIGAGLESRNKIRESTYGFRHYRAQNTRED